MGVIDLHGPYGNCPVQCSGKVDDKDFYFRARYDAWELAIADHDAVGSLFGDEEPLYLREAQYGPDGEFAAGWMPTRIARLIIECCIAEYRAGVRGAFQGRPPRLPKDAAPIIVWDSEQFTGVSA